MHAEAQKAGQHALPGFFVCDLRDRIGGNLSLYRFCIKPRKRSFKPNTQNLQNLKF